MEKSEDPCGSPVCHRLGQWAMKRVDASPPKPRPLLWLKSSESIQRLAGPLGRTPGPREGLHLPSEIPHAQGAFFQSSQIQLIFVCVASLTHPPGTSHEIEIVLVMISHELNMLFAFRTGIVQHKDKR